MDGLIHRRGPARGNRHVRQHEMRITELLLIGDGEAHAEHRDDDARAIGYDLERLIHHSQLDRKKPRVGTGLRSQRRCAALAARSKPMPDRFSRPAAV